MRQLLTLCVLLTLSVLAGCNKQADSKEVQTGAQKGREAVTTPAVDPAMEAAGVGATESKQATFDLLASLAPDYGIQYDKATNLLTGEGFPDEGVHLSKLVSIIETKLSAKAEATDADRETEVRTVLKQLSSVGKATAAQQGKQVQTAGGDSADTAGDASSTQAGPPSRNMNPTPDQMMFPDQIYGDWHSIREEHASTVVEHDENYFESISFRYGEDIAVFHQYRDGKLVSNNEFPYEYEPGTGTITIYDPARKPMMTMIATATDPDPYLLWIQREGAKKKTLYDKKGRGGEPVTLEDEIEGVRILKGDEAAEEYRRQKEKERREGNGG